MFWALISDYGKSVVLFNVNLLPDSLSEGFDLFPFDLNPKFYKVNVFYCDDITFCHFLT